MRRISAPRSAAPSCGVGRQDRELVGLEAIHAVRHPRLCEEHQGQALEHGIGLLAAEPLHDVREPIHLQQAKAQRRAVCPGSVDRLLNVTIEGGTIQEASEMIAPGIGPDVFEQPPVLMLVAERIRQDGRQAPLAGRERVGAAEADPARAGSSRMDGHRDVSMRAAWPLAAASVWITLEGRDRRVCAEDFAQGRGRVDGGRASGRARAA